MTRLVLDALIFVLIPMGLFPVIVAIILGPHIYSRSTALKERARLSILLGLLGLLVSILAANVLLELGIAMIWLWLAFVVLLILIDGASAIWLWLFLKGKFGTD